MCKNSEKNPDYSVEGCGRKWDFCTGPFITTLVKMVNWMLLLSFYISGFNQIKISSIIIFFSQQLFNCQALKKLSIPDNDLSNLPTTIASLVNLKELDISKNGKIFSSSINNLNFFSFFFPFLNFILFLNFT